MRFLPLQKQESCGMVYQITSAQMFVILVKVNRKRVKVCFKVQIFENTRYDYVL